MTGSIIGRVVNAQGEAIDGGEPLTGGEPMPVVRPAPDPFERTPIRLPLGTGVRAIDAFLTCGHGQRVGIFGGSGVGKSTLMGMMARGTSADLTVVALIGERGREVREFLEDALGEAGRTPLDRRRLHLGPIASAASARCPIGPRDCRIFRRSRQTRTAGTGLHHPLRYGPARNRTGRR